MAKRSTKRSIYFPDALDRRMDEFSGENWSGICQEAVTAHIRTLELRSKTMLSAIERASARLATSKARYVEQAGERGRKAGADWAADRAEYAELMRLNAASEALPWENWDEDEVEGKIVGIILGDRGELAEFREAIELTDEADARSEDFWYGFVEAAVEVFDKAGI